MKEVGTYCRICEPQCALVARVDESNEAQPIRLLPNKEHPVHKGFACHKGLNFTQIHMDPDRLDFPQQRNADGTLERVSWNAASEQIATELKRISDQWGTDAIGMYIGNPSAFNSTGRDAARKFAQQIGVKYRFGSGTQDCSNKFAASEAVFGTANLHPIPDFAHTNYFLSLGSNPKISHVSFVHMTNPMQTLRDIVSRGGKVKHVNPRDIESATPASGDLVQIKPDTDLFLLAALIHEIVAANLHDAEYIAAHADSFDELMKFTSQYDADTVSAVTGLAAEEIRTLAREFATAQGASVHMSTGVNMGTHGTLAYWLLQMLSLITGNLGRRGGNIYSPGYFPAATVGKPRSDNPFFASPFAEVEDMRTIAGSLPGNLMADYIEAGHVKALVCMSGNPVLSMAGEKRLQEAFKKLELLVVVDIYPNATAQQADYLLPATDWLEREDINSVSLGFQPVPYVQYAPAVVAPRFERKPEWWIFGSLLQSLGLPSVLDNEQFDPLSRLDRQLESADLNVNHLREQPHNTIVLGEPEPETLMEVGLQFDAVQCFPPLIQRGIQTAHDHFAQLQAEDDQTLKLITLRTNYMVNSWMHNIPALKRDTALNNPLHMHPQDVERLGFKQGQEVAVSTEHGSVIATVEPDADFRPGVVGMTHGWGHANNADLSLANNHPGVNVNAILPTGAGSYDPLSNMSYMTGIAVNVAAA